ncbi:NUDIX domain-containing protein [Enemella evansiae]|uniref:NUDIX domain-containing protein n=1 Tax=Enemella evansiae TaxID=2016499 RepID=UPI000C00784B|nr:ADP-ribose pyrophosphatase [Propionibacteriaceae bacterium ES.041]
MSEDWIQRFPLRRGAEVADVGEHWPVRERRLLGKGHLFDYVGDVVETPSGETMTRDWLDHVGAVGVIAVDDEFNVIVIGQYRHPLGQRLVEPPAGLLDVHAEAYQLAAARELAEEAGLAASDWRVLVDITTTPGGVSETLRMYLATGLSAAPAPEGFTLQGEEAHLDHYRVPLADLVDGILAGRLQSPSLVSGCLALWAARDRLDALRPADAPWPARDQVAELRAAAPIERAPDGEHRG